MISGIRVSQEGVSVRRAAEYQLILDERWPLMDFLFTGIINVNYVSNAGGPLMIDLYPHKLGFLPGFFSYMIQLKSKSAGVYYNSPSDLQLYASTQNVYAEFFRTDGQATTVESISASFYVGILNRDFSKIYQAPSVIVPAGSVSGPSSHGVKVLNSGSSVGMKSRNKSEYNLHTNAKSLGIHMHGRVAVNEMSTGPLKLNHKLGYPPTFMVTRIDKENDPASPLYNQEIIRALSDQDPGEGKSTSTELTISGAQSALVGDFVYIILKDPVDVAR